MSGPTGSSVQTEMFTLYGDQRKGGGGWMELIDIGVNVGKMLRQYYYFS